MDDLARDALAYALRLAHAELESKRQEQESLQAGLEQLERLLDSNEMTDAKIGVPSLKVPHLQREW